MIKTQHGVFQGKDEKETKTNTFTCRVEIWEISNIQCSDYREEVKNVDSFGYISFSAQLGVQFLQKLVFKVSEKPASVFLSEHGPTDLQVAGMY